MATIRGFIAQSLDGYIAAADHSLDWLPPIDGFNYVYQAFIAEIRTVVMGRKTYAFMEGLPEWPYPGVRGLIVTSTPLEAAPAGVEAWHDGLAALVAHLRSLDDGDVWVIGGGGLQSAMLDAGGLDRLEITIIPVLLGDGVPLWPRSPSRHQLALEVAEPAAHGAVRVIYGVPRPAG